MRNVVLALSGSLLLNTMVAQHKNQISIYPFLPVFGTIQVQYERALEQQMSLSLSVGIKTSSGVFAVSGIGRNNISTDDFNFQGIKIIPEFRWYLQEDTGGLNGFYIGAFAKFQDFRDAISGVYTDSDQMDNDIEIDAKIHTFGAGAEVGYKLMIKEKFFIDFLIAGPGISANKIRLVEKQPLPEEFYNDLSDALSQYGFFEWLDTDFRIN